MAESFETAVPWDKLKPLITNVTNNIMENAKTIGCKKAPFVSFRIT